LPKPRRNEATETTTEIHNQKILVALSVFIVLSILFR
jgi:hypothetical protein